MPKEMTEDEVRKKFLRYCWSMVEYWDKESRRETTSEKLQGLMHSIPSLARKKERLIPIEGVVPDPIDVPPGCGFEPRCPQRMEICKEKMPPLKGVGLQHTAACWLYGEQE